MLDKVKVSRYLQDFRDQHLPEAVEREMRLPVTKMVLTIYGPRRCGKSYYLYQLIRQALEAGATKEDILLLDFEDTRLADLGFKDLEDVLRLHFELFPGSSTAALRVFLDEPQLMPGWERAVRSLHDKGTLQIYVTGSSAKLLVSEIATSLRGRTLPFLLLPYSFREFLSARGIATGGPHPGTVEESRTKAALSDYLSTGGFPEVVKELDEGTRTRILVQYLNLLIYRDVVERHGVENLAMVKFLLEQLFSSFAREMSVNKLYNTARSRGIAVSKRTAYEYVGYLEDALAVILLHRWAASPRVRGGYLPKVYIVDNGYARLFPTGSEDLGRLAENAVMVELRRMRDADPLLETYYWKDVQGRSEVDFALRRRGEFVRLIQVCRSPEAPDTREREERALLEASEELGCDKLTVLTWDLEETREVGGRTIEYVPLWRWLQFGGI
jgi:hypothetical protein